MCERGRDEMEEQEVSQVARAWEQGRGGAERSKRDISRGRDRIATQLGGPPSPFKSNTFLPDSACSLG